MSPRPAVDVFGGLKPSGACRIWNEKGHSGRYVLHNEASEPVAACTSAQVLSSWAFDHGADTVRHSYLEEKPTTDSKTITHG